MSRLHTNQSRFGFWARANGFRFRRGKFKSISRVRPQQHFRLCASPGCYTNNITATAASTARRRQRRRRRRQSASAIYQQRSGHRHRHRRSGREQRRHTVNTAQRRVNIGRVHAQRSSLALTQRRARALQRHMHAAHGLSRF